MPWVNVESGPGPTTSDWSQMQMAPSQFSHHGPRMLRSTEEGFFLSFFPWVLIGPFVTRCREDAGLLVFVLYVLLSSLTKHLISAIWRFHH